MGNRPSTITRLPQEVQDRITELRDRGRTIDEIMAALEPLLAPIGTDISRSALGRHLKKMDKVAEQMRRSRELAKAVGRQFGDAETSQVARTNIELMHSLLMKVMVGEEGTDDEVTLNPMEVMLMSKALDHLAKAGKTDFEMQLKAALEIERKVATEKATENAAEKAVTEARKHGLSAETVSAIKSSILGILP